KLLKGLTQKLHPQASLAGTRNQHATLKSNFRHTAANLKSCNEHRRGCASTIGQCVPWQLLHVLPAYPTLNSWVCLAFGYLRGSRGICVKNSFGYMLPVWRAAYCEMRSFVADLERLVKVKPLCVLMNRLSTIHHIYNDQETPRQEHHDTLVAD